MKAPPRWKVILGFAVLYLVWGSTYLGVRIVVAEAPPFLFAALRFLLAGGFLLIWSAASGVPIPRPRYWAAVLIPSFLIFVLDYGLLFWAEKRVPSGVAAVLMATIPLFMAASEITILRTQRLTFRLSFALLVGIAGIAVLMSRSPGFGGQPIWAAGAAALLLAAASWVAASILLLRVPGPDSKLVASAVQMLLGGLMLAASSALLGEFRGFRPAAVSAPAWWALIYVTAAGSVLGYTTYLWLLHCESPTKISTYAYVNPVIAVLIGHFLGREALGPRTLLGTACILASVILITTLGPARTRNNEIEEKAAV